MATVSELRDGLKTRLATIPTLRAHSEEPDDINVTVGKAVAYPIPQDGGPDTFDGTERTVFTIVVLVAPAVGPGRGRGQRMIDPYISRGDPSDIKAAIEADKTLGGVADDLAVGRWNRYGQIDVGGTPYWGVMREVEVLH